MYFEIVGEVSEVEVIAAGRSIRRPGSCGGDTVVGIGVKQKALQQFGWLAARCGAPNCIGTKPTALGGKIGKSNGLWTDSL